MKEWPNPFSIDGVLLIDKPRGLTSHDVVNRVRKVFQIGKAGHGGTLDPDATGLLLILLGKATKFFDDMLAKDKTYIGIMRLGRETNTQDAEGETVAEKPFDSITREQVEAAFRNFRGDIFQTPPMMSAVKVNGMPLYKLALQGEEIDRKPRFVHVYRLDITNWAPPLVTFEILCTKGTYVRTIAHDAGKLLGCGACLEGLRRTQSGPFHVEDAVPYDSMVKFTTAQLTEKVIPVPKALELIKSI